MRKYLCPCCGESLLLHIRENKKIGFCPTCYQEMPLLSYYDSKEPIATKQWQNSSKELAEILSLNHHNINFIIQDSTYGAWVISKNQKTLFANKKLTQILGYTAEEFHFKPFWALIDQHHPIHQVFNSKSCLNQSEEYELKLLHKQGYWIWVKLSLTSLLNQENQCNAYLIQVLDLTGLKQIEYQLQQRTTREKSISYLLQVMRGSSSLQSIFTAAVAELGHLLPVTSVQVMQYISQDKTWISRAEHHNHPLDLEDKKYFNNSFNSTDDHRQVMTQKVTAIELEEIDLPLKILVNPSQSSELVIDEGMMDNFLQSCPGAWLPIPLYCESSIWGCLSLVMQEPKYGWQSSDQRFIQTIADQLSIAIYQAQLHQQLEQASLKLKTLSTLDLLTQLPNRYGFNQYLNQTWQKLSNHQQHLTTILCHIDNFLYYQNTYGSSVANECLKQIGFILRSNLTDPDQMVARYSGAEFVLLLPHAEADEAIKMIDTLQAEIEHLKINSSQTTVALTPNVSFGIASVVPQLGLSPQQLLTNAEQALDQGASALCKCLLAKQETEELCP
jgi:diguanylate cyclase (GGDEF)-like protein/PAS domain S-box-containing protein